MALVTTAGASDADAFASVETVTAYAAARGHDGWLSGYTDTWEAAIRRATQHLCTAYSWKGYRTDGRSQALAWPRADVYDAEGEAVDADAIPAEIVQATCELAIYELANPNGLAPVVEMTGRIKSEQVGSLRVEYASAPVSAEAARPVLLLVKDMVAGLVDGAASNPLVGRAVRG